MASTDRDLGQTLALAARILRRELAAELRQYGLDDTSYIMMRTLDNAVGSGTPAMTIEDMASELCMAREVVADAADRLIRDGWLTQLDAETRLVALSGKARTAMPGLSDTANWTIQRTLNGFTDEEVDALNAYLERVIGNLR